VVEATDFIVFFDWLINFLSIARPPQQGRECLSYCDASTDAALILKGYQGSLISDEFAVSPVASQNN
jgi:hypothetical protein